MNINSVEDIYKLMENIYLHNIKLSIHNINIFCKIINKFIEEREVELTQNGIYYDDWIDDDLIIQLTEYIDILQKTLEHETNTSNK